MSQPEESAGTAAMKCDRCKVKDVRVKALGLCDDCLMAEPRCPHGGASGYDSTDFMPCPLCDLGDDQEAAL